MTLKQQALLYLRFYSNSIPIVKEGIISIAPIKNFDHFIISSEELLEIQHVHNSSPWL